MKTLSFRAGIYIGWVGHFNLGDEAMYDLCRQRFSDIHWSRSRDIAYAPNPGQFVRNTARNPRRIFQHLSDELSTHRRTFSLFSKTMHKLAQWTGQEVGMFGGGTLINRNADVLHNYLGIRQRTGSLVPIFGSGVNNPDFWLTHESGWIDRRAEWVSVLAELPVVGVRGPVSKDFLDDAGAQNVVVCGDPAVLFHKQYADMSSSLHKTGPLHIGINTGDCLERMWGRADDVEESFVALARWLRQAGHRIEIIPIWHKDVPACLELARKAGLDGSAVSPVLYTPASFLARAENLDLMVCLKLHAGILAAAANVPFVSLEYQPKCRDFAASIGWEEFVIRTDRLQPGRLIDVVATLMGQLDSKRTELCRSMCGLMHRFEHYCDQIEPLLLRSS